MGISNLMLFERNSYLGGILIQCIHPGFGLIKFKEELSGPEFALKYIELIDKYHIPYRLDSMVINVKNNEIMVSSEIWTGNV